MSIENIIGQIGLGGESGFEIQQNVAPETYEVVTKALVTDEVTQELKLLVATSRNGSASSVLGTMAIDVFPIQGRPHLKDLVAPAMNLQGTTSPTAPVQITSNNILPHIYVGKAMSELVFTAVKGTAPYSWFSNNLPVGLFLDIDGTLHGTPMVLGTFYINVAVSDSTEPAYIDTKVFTLIIESDLSLPVSPADPQDPTGKTHLMPPAFVASTTEYSEAISVTGGSPPYVFELDTTPGQGNPPQGLTVSSDGLLTGWPVSYNSSSDFVTPFTFWVIVTDSLGATATRKYSMILNGPNLTIGQTDTQTAYLGNPLKIAIPVYGGVAPYTLESASIDIQKAPILKSPLKISF